MLADILALQGAMQQKEKKLRTKRHNPAKKWERAEQVYNAVPEHGTISTPEVAKIVGCTVHMANRALDRLQQSGKLIKIRSHHNLNNWQRVTDMGNG